MPPQGKQDSSLPMSAAQEGASEACLMESRTSHGKGGRIPQEEVGKEPVVSAAGGQQGLRSS